MAHETIARRTDKNSAELVDHVHYSPSQIARVVGLHADTIRKMMDEGRFPRSYGVTKNRGVWGRQVRAYLERQTLAPGHTDADDQGPRVGGDPPHPTDHVVAEAQLSSVGGVDTSGTTTSQKKSDAQTRRSGGRPVSPGPDVCTDVRDSKGGGQ